MSRRTVVDPRFGCRLRELRLGGDLSLRDLAQITHFGRSTLSELENGVTQPSADTAQILDNALTAHGELARMVRPANGADDRAHYVARHPRRLDAATVETLEQLLAGQRRMEDAIGAAPMVAPVLAQLEAVEGMVTGAPDTALRTRLVDVAGQWAQFAAWLTATTGDHNAARQHYLRAMEWATEAGNPDLMATVLSMRGHLAWIKGQVRPMIELSRAAQWQPASRGVRGLATQQEARGLALVGDARTADRRLSEAEDLVRTAAEQPADEPPWMYFFDVRFLAAQRGLAQHLMGRHERASAELATALDALPPEIRQSDWIGWYVLQLARALVASGERGEAVKALEEARQIADRAGAVRLQGEVADLALELGL